jgi:hypothetical protein
MAAKWVDNSAYFGPDRRRRPNKRLLDRRRHNEAGEPPPLAGLLRRLRVRISAPGAEDRRQALEMLKAAIGEASRLGWRECAAVLADADQALRTGGREGVTIADACVVQALDHASAGR